MPIHIPEDQQGKPTNLLTGHAPEIVAAGLNFSKTTYLRSKLSLREFEGARARTAEINGCRLCQAWRSARDLPGYFAAIGVSADGGSVADRGPVPDEDFYRSVSRWRESPIYSERERVAIEYAERMGIDPKGLAGDEEFWTRMKATFSDEEIVDLSYCIACWMGLGRATHVLGIDGVCAIPSAGGTAEAA
jgi:alkylhydroperoxidase family enzyme